MDEKLKAYLRDCRTLDGIIRDRWPGDDAEGIQFQEPENPGDFGKWEFPPDPCPGVLEVTAGAFEAVEEKLKGGRDRDRAGSVMDWMEAAGWPSVLYLMSNGRARKRGSFQPIEMITGVGEVRLRFDGDREFKRIFSS